MTSRFYVLSLSLLLVSSACKTAAPQNGETSDYTEKMAVEHTGDTPVKNDATDAVDESLRGEEVVYATVDGVEVKGFLVEPADVKGQVIVIHEWWGLNDNIRAMAKKVAQEGYRVLAVDLYGGAWAADPEKAKALMGNAMKNPDAAKANLVGAHGFLKAKGDQKIGVMGWCFGGHWSLQTAILLPTEISATVIYYGRLVEEREVLEPIAMPVLGIFGALDKGIPVASVKAFEKTMKELGKDVSIHVYEGADHAFANPSGTRYQKESADDAWQKTLTFLQANLQR